MAKIRSTQELVEQFLIQRYTHRQLVQLYREADEIYQNAPLETVTATEEIMERLVTTVIPDEIHHRFYVLETCDDAGVHFFVVRSARYEEHPGILEKPEGKGETIADALENFLDNAGR